MDQVLTWFGKEEYENRLARVEAFWNGNERFMVSVYAHQNTYRQIFDSQKILSKAPLHLEEQAQLPGMNLPSFFVDLGSMSNAKYWGGNTHFDSTGGNIFIDPVAQTMDEALALKPLPVDAPGMDGPQCLHLFREICKKLETTSLWMRTPDLQGPLTTAAMILNQEELMMAMRTDPDQVHAFLSEITDFLIKYIQYLQKGAEGKICGTIWPYTFLPLDMGLCFTEDLMPLLSADIYREFATPYLKKLGETFGSLHIHCCGQWGRHAQTLKNSGAWIREVEFHYPFTKIEELEYLSENTVFVPYISLDKQKEFRSISEYYQHLLDSTNEHHRFWFAFPEASEEAISFAKHHFSSEPVT